MANDKVQLKDPLPSELVQEDESFADLVEEFLQGMPDRISQIQSALHEHSFEVLRKCAHQLKGSGGGYGYPALTELAAQLEQDAVAEQIDACTAQVAELEDLVSRMVVSTG